MTQRPKAVVALNGFLGDRVGHLDVGELTIAYATMAGAAFYARRRGGAEQGGWKPFAKRRVKEWVYRKISESHEIVFVGKSYGAHWIVDFFQEPHIASRSHAFLFDPSRSLTRGEDKTRPACNAGKITVVRQTGFRSGYRVDGSRDVVIKADHKDIESSRSGLLHLYTFLDHHLSVPWSSTR